MTEQFRNLTDRILASGVVPALSLDAVLVAALSAIGVSIHRLSPDLVWGYAGALLLVAWWSIGKAKAKGPK